MQDVATKKLLLIGGKGFAGRHVASMSGLHEVVSTGRECDVRDYGSVVRLIEEERPDRVIHLAAVTTLAESFENPRMALDVNFGGVFNVLSALQESGFEGEMLFVSSSEVYGPVDENELPVGEDRLPRPKSPYAVGKIAAEALCCQWQGDFKIVVARPFNHIGPGQSQRFSIPNFARQISDIKLGFAEPVISVGDIDISRDFADVRDVARAYLLLLEKGRSGEIYNVCSGRDRTIRSLIEQMCEIAGVEVEFRMDPSRVRGNEQRRVVGNHGKISSATGWAPELSMDVTLSDLLHSM